MKIFFANLFYFVVTTAWTYGFHWVLILFIYAVRFTAADGPPGDIDVGSKLVYSVGFPLFNFVFITFLFLLYRRFLQNTFRIELKRAIPIAFNAGITVYFIYRIVYEIFDYHL